MDSGQIIVVRETKTVFWGEGEQNLPEYGQLSLQISRKNYLNCVNGLATPESKVVSLKQRSSAEISGN